MFDGHWRAGVEVGVKPVGSALHRAGVTADQLTGAGLAMAGVAAVVIGSGHLRWGVVLLALAAVPDLLDGAVAKVAGTSSPRGAFFDSVADRVTDTLILGGIAWHLAITDGGLAPMLAFAVLGSSTLISYERAKAEALGYAAKGGLMERAERIIAIGIGLAFPVLLQPILWLMLALTLFTAGQRFLKVWRQASVARPIERSDTRAAVRFRAWRDATAERSTDWTSGAMWRARREGPRTGRSTHRRAGARRP